MDLPSIVPTSHTVFGPLHASPSPARTPPRDSSDRPVDAATPGHPATISFAAVAPESVHSGRCDAMR